MFNTSFNFYGFFLVLGFLANIIIIRILFKNLLGRVVGQFLIYEFVGILAGGKLYTYIFSYSTYANESFWSLGLSSLGGVIGAIIMITIFAYQFKIDFKKLLALAIIPMPLMYGLGKIGCFLTGCCFGLPYNGPMSVMYKYSDSAPLNVSLFPIQLVEAIIFILIFIYIYRKYLKVKKYDIVLYNVLILSCLAKFLLDFFRFSHQGKIITLNQIVCLFFVILGLIFYYKSKKSKTLSI